jgi:hypothetical protein
MKKLTLVLALLLMFAIPAAAQQLRVKGNRTPLRGEPSTASTALTYYQMGTTLEALEFMNGWYKVRDPQTKVEGFILATLVEVLAGPGAVRPAPDRPPARTPPKPGARLVLDVAGVWMTASESFKAVADSDMRVQYGGGLQIVDLWKGLYAEVTVGWSRLSGSRVFVYEGAVYDLGIPATMTFYPIDAGGGWRFRHGRKLHSYLGGGVEFLKYKEESDFANAEDNVDEVFTGYYATGGVEVLLARWLHLRGEVRYTGVPNALGAGGVSADFGETDLGGVAVAVKLAIGK